MTPTLLFFTTLYVLFLCNVNGYRFASQIVRRCNFENGVHNRLHPVLAQVAGNGPAIDDETRARIDKIVSSNKVVLFMKGNKLFPQCGFSNTACRILDALNTPFETVNVLDDDKIRQGIKAYSSWPTIPQLYVAGEFVGGSDIMVEMYQAGTLGELIEVANAN